MVHYNTVADVSLTVVGPQIVIYLTLSLLYVYRVYSCYKMYWMANTEIGLDLNNSVIKRLWFRPELKNCLIVLYLPSILILGR